MANKTIQQYTAASTIDGTNDLLLEYQNSSGVYKSINRSTFLGVSGQPADISTIQTLTNKTLTSPVISSPVFSGTMTGTYTIGGTPTFPSSVATLTGVQTLTNKTLTSPIITGGTIDNATITVDSISGHTTSTIVTVGGVQMNNGTIATSNAIVAATITDGAVTPAKLQAGTGTGWSWTSWTPSWTNLTPGNGVATCKFIQVGKQVTCRFSFVLGTTSSVGTAIFFTLPVTAVSYPNIANDIDIIGSAILFGTGVQNDGLVAIADTTTGRLYLKGAAATYVNITDITASTPFVWATNNALTATFTYEAA